MQGAGLRETQSQDWSQMRRTRSAPPFPARGPAAEGGREGLEHGTQGPSRREGSRLLLDTGGPPSQFGQTGHVDSKEAGRGGTLSRTLSFQARLRALGAWMRRAAAGHTAGHALTGSREPPARFSSQRWLFSVPRDSQLRGGGSGARLHLWHPERSTGQEAASSRTGSLGGALSLPGHTVSTWAHTPI